MTDSDTDSGETPVLQSIENRLKTDLILTALESARLKLREFDVPYEGPYSTLGMIARAQETRRASLRAQHEFTAAIDTIIKEAPDLPGTLPRTSGRP